MMRDKRYMLSRRRYNSFERTTPTMFKMIDEAQRRLDHPKPVFGFWAKCGLVVYILSMIAINVYVARRAPAPEPPSAKQLALDAAAAERAAAFVRALGFEPGPAVCRALESGSAWCTVRVSGSDKTFSLWCSRRHPVCIENLPRE